ncbi:MAG: thiol-disulfide oxidoreductase DCC family protein [Candidatus Acidiferrales bacterium]
MVSLISEITESKGPRARRGWVFFDADCRFCVAIARRLQTIFVPRGFGFAPLQDPRAQAQLGLPPEELLSEMRVLSADGRQFGRADALIFLARFIWWISPLAAFAELPGMRSLLRRGYRWVAAHRSCRAGACSLTPAPRVLHEKFLEGGNRK